MTPYELLRDEAANKRDKAISAAHVEYRRTLDKIEALRLQLNSELVESEKSVKQLVEEVIPKGKPFVRNDIVHSLTLAHPGRDFRKATVNTILYKLGRAGLLKRISKDGRGQITWGDQSCDGELEKERPLIEIIADVLEGSEGMLLVDIAIAVQRTGRLASKSGQAACRAVSKSLHSDPGRFSKDENGTWGTAVVS